jgi:hypothetical protein
MVDAARSAGLVLLESYIVPAQVGYCALSPVPTQVDSKAPAQRAVTRSNWSPLRQCLETGSQSSKVKCAHNSWGTASKQQVDISAYFILMRKNGEPNFP